MISSFGKFFVYNIVLLLYIEHKIYFYNRGQSISIPFHKLIFRIKNGLFVFVHFSLIFNIVLVHHLEIKENKKEISFIQRHYTWAIYVLLTEIRY